MTRNHRDCLLTHIWGLWWCGFPLTIIAWFGIILSFSIFLPCSKVRFQAFFAILNNPFKTFLGLLPWRLMFKTLRFLLNYNTIYWFALQTLVTLGTCISGRHSCKYQLSWLNFMQIIFSAASLPCPGKWRYPVNIYLILTRAW